MSPGSCLGIFGIFVSQAPLQDPCLRIHVSASACISGSSARSSVWIVSVVLATNFAAQAKLGAIPSFEPCFEMAVLALIATSLSPSPGFSKPQTFIATFPCVLGLNNSKSVRQHDQQTGLIWLNLLLITGKWFAWKKAPSLDPDRVRSICKNKKDLPKICRKKFNVSSRRDLTNIQHLVLKMNRNTKAPSNGLGRLLRTSLFYNRPKSKVMTEKGMA